MLFDKFYFRTCTMKVNIAHMAVYEWQCDKTRRVDLQSTIQTKHKSICNYKVSELFGWQRCRWRSGTGQKEIHHGFHAARFQTSFAKKKLDDHEMPPFDFRCIEEKEVIGCGSYGIVYKARYISEDVVLKKILGESIDEEDSFIKEARLIRSLKHRNIVSFKAFCASPLAIMLEYVYFDFAPF